MKVIIQKPDLDTCLSGLILNVRQSDEIIVARQEAEPDDLQNPEVLCIESGGSGLVHFNCFDHHNMDIYFPPACRQAYEHCKISDLQLLRLVDYVCLVDEALRFENSIAFPSVSNLFSGMLFAEPDPMRQFFKGMEMLRTVLDEKLDPFCAMPDLEQWKAYRAAKEEHKKKLQTLSGREEFYVSQSGLGVGFMETGLIVGGKDFLHAHDCDAVILHNPCFGIPPVSKYTIVSKEIPLSDLKKCFDEKESGWGGRDTILGSPRNGTKLNKHKVLETVLANLGK